MAMTVKLYHNKSAPNVISKSLASEHTSSCTFFNDEALSVTHPKILVKLSNDNSVSDLAKYNYCYISDLKRYFYIDDISALGGLALISCHVDVLMSFKKDILASTQYVLRQQTKNDSPYLPDDMLPIKSTHNYWFKTFGQDVIKKDCARVILATTGKGGHVV